MKADVAFNIYFQDEYPDSKGPCREYFFNILNTVYPEYLAKIMAHAASERMAPTAEANKKEAIEISEYWAEQLKSMPYVSRKYFAILPLT